MSKSNLSKLLQQEFQQLSRKLTYFTIAFICLAAIIFWWHGVEVKGNTAMLIGSMFMIVAAFTLNIPYFTYRYMLKKYKDDPEKQLALGPNWREFRESAMGRK